MVEVGRDDSLGDLAGKMRNGEDSLTLFRLINGMTARRNALAGTKVKIVTDS